MIKPYMVSFDKNTEVVGIRVVGSATHDDHCRARDEAARLCRSSGCRALLVDLRELSTSRSSTLNCFLFGKELAEELPGFRLAYVLPGDQKSAEDVKFTVTVAINRGICGKHFTSIEDAEKWLDEKNKEPQDPTQIFER